MSDTPSEPREFQLCRLFDGGGEVLHWFVEKSALVAANAELEKWKQAAKDQDEYCDRVEEESEKLKAEIERANAEHERQQYDIRCKHQSTINELDQMKFEYDNSELAYQRLTNQYNEQLDLARHRAVELNEMASIANNAHRIIAELHTELGRAKAENKLCTQLGTANAERFQWKKEREKLESMAESYRVKLAKCVDAMFSCISRSDDYGDSHCSQPIRQVIHEARAALDQGEK